MKRWAALLVGILATAPSAFSDQPLTDRQLEDSLKQLDDWKDSVKEQAKSVSNTFRAILRDEDRLKSRRKLFECQMKYGWLFDDVTPIENRAKGAKEPGKGPRLSEKELRNTFKVL